MINTVNGPISPNDLGVTLIHEHIIVDFNGPEEGRKRIYEDEEVINLILPYLMNLKETGCNSLVEASPDGLGRNINALKRCSELSGLNIVTCTGMWDGRDFQGKLVRTNLKEKEIDEVAEIWINEYMNGIEGTRIKPGFIKLALGGEGFISDLQERMLRAAVRTSLNTGLTIACHICPIESVNEAVIILEEEGLPLNKFIWCHVDAAKDVPTIIEMGQKGLWLESDGLGRTTDFQWYVDTIAQLIDKDLMGRVLISQDAGRYMVGRPNNKDTVVPYTRVFNEFIPFCLVQGISQNLIDELLTTHPKIALDDGK